MVSCSRRHLNGHICQRKWQSVGNITTISNKRLQPVREFVRQVDYSQVPQIGELAKRIRQLANEFYPKIIELLGVDGGNSPRQFDIVFQHLKSGDVGQTIG